MAVWDTSYVNDLPDSAFLLIAPGGHKDSQGKTMPRNLRYFPVRNAAGDVDAAHLRNALAQIPKASTLSAAQREQAMSKAKSMAADHPSVGGPAGTYAGSAGSGRSRPPVEVMTRTFRWELELRADGDGRTVMGRAVPYGEIIAIPAGKERFFPGAFDRQIQAGRDVIGQVKIHASHDGAMSGDVLSPVGRTVHLEDRADGLHGAWRMYDTPRGEEALYLVKTGEVTGLSVGFKPVDGGSRRAIDGTWERHAVHLDHVVLTAKPAYVGAAVTGVRSAHPIGGYRTELLRARQILDQVRTGG